MGSYLDTYGVKEARRGRLIKRIVYSALGLAVVSLAGWFFLRNYAEESRVRDFMALLEKKDYKAAHALWGCTDATPCRDYGYTRFVEDWGPTAGPVSRVKVKSCDGGIIQFLTVQGKETLLYVDRQTKVISFAPWPVCTPHVKI